MKYRITITPKNTVKWPLHKHEHYEVMYYTKGEGYLDCQTRKYKFKEGTIIVVPPNVMHGSISQDGFENISVASDFKNFRRTGTL